MFEALGNETHLGLGIYKCFAFNETGGREAKLLLKPRDRRLPPEDKTLLPLHSQSLSPRSEHIRLLEWQPCDCGSPESRRPDGDLALLQLSLPITDLARDVGTKVNPMGELVPVMRSLSPLVKLGSPTG